MQQQGRYLQVNMLQLRCSPMALLLAAATFETRAISLLQLYDKPRQFSTACTAKFCTGVTDDRHITCVV